MIEEIAALVQITKSVYKAGVWVRNTRVNWNVPSLTGVANIEGKLEAEYYSFAKDDGGVKKFLLKRKNFTEEKRLINDRARLLDFYPGLRGCL